MSSERISGIVNAVSDVKEHDGKIQIGWTLKANPKRWYNQLGEEAELEILLKEIISKGNEIEFNYDTLGAVVSGLVKIKEAEPGQKSWEDDIVTFETLLNAAHGMKRPFSIKTEMIAIDLEKKYALFKALVTAEIDTEREVVFEGHGDSTEDNVTGDFIKPHFIRMAETRAICRALRWYTNNAQIAEEEKSETEVLRSKSDEELKEMKKDLDMQLINAKEQKEKKEFPKVKKTFQG